MSPPKRPASPAQAIIVDEIGIEAGVYGPYRLKSCYRPIFAPGDGALLPVAVQGDFVAWHGEASIASSVFLAEVPAADVALVQDLARLLHLRNHRNIGVDGLELFIGCEAPTTDGKALAEMAAGIAVGLSDAELDPGLLVCEITDTAAMDGEALGHLAAAFGRHGIRFAINDFGIVHPTEQRIALRPDTVKLDGGSFRKLAGDVATVRLLAAAVRGFQGEGARVLIDGIDAPQLLAAAMETGADMLQGNLFGAPALAGTMFDAEPKQLERLLAMERKIIPLFG